MPAELMISTSSTIESQTSTTSPLPEPTRLSWNPLGAAKCGEKERGDGVITGRHRENNKIMGVINKSDGMFYFSFIKACKKTMIIVTNGSVNYIH